MGCNLHIPYALCCLWVTVRLATDRHSRRVFRQLAIGSGVARDGNVYGSWIDDACLPNVQWFASITLLYDFKARRTGAK